MKNKITFKIKANNLKQPTFCILQSLLKWKTFFTVKYFKMTTVLEYYRRKNKLKQKQPAKFSSCIVHNLDSSAVLARH